MRKLGVWIVIFSMIFSIFSFYPGTWKHVKGASSNKEALNVAVRFHRINYNEYDEKMESWKIVPWMDTPEETWWGRSGFEMPNAQLAKDPANPTEVNGVFHAQIDRRRRHGHQRHARRANIFVHIQAIHGFPNPIAYNEINARTPQKAHCESSLRKIFFIVSSCE